MNGSMSRCSQATTARLHALEHVLTLIETSDPPEETTESWLYLVMAYYWMAEIGRAFDVALRWAACSERSQQPDQMEAAYTRLGLLYASQGAWLEAERALDQALAVTASIGRLESSDMLCSIRGLLAFQRGEYAIAGQAFQTLLTGPWGNADLGFFCIPFLSLMLVNTRNQDEAARSLEKLQELLTRLPAGTLPTLPILLGLALLAVALGKRAQAAELYQELLMFQGQHCWFLVDRILGAIATFSGDWPAAERHFSRAEATARRENLLPELARTLVERADLELARGKKAAASQANTYLMEALDLSEKLAMYEMAEGIRHRLGLLPRRSEKPRVSSLPASLTRRELAVLRLVAEGKSNYQIAQKLNLSEKTVANHLTTIFYKTASENRAAATAFAIRHGLA
jgi:DNA-binding CsgD family transcriptional regulator